MRTMCLRLARSCVVLGLGIGLGGCSLLCPGDVDMAASLSAHGPYASADECEKARKDGVCSPITKPDAACIAHCKSGWYPGGCLATATNPSSVVGAACYPKQEDGKYYYSCSEKATCHCV